MASGATLDFGFVLVDERTLLVRMAFVANLVIAIGAAKLMGLKTTVGIMAIAALQQPFVDAVMKWPGELRLYIQVAAEAQLWRGLFQQELLFLCVVGVVAFNARNPTLQVGRASVVVVFPTILVAIEAAGAYLGRGDIFKGENLGFVATAIYVSFARSVARFATLPFGAGMGIELGCHSGCKVWCILEVFGQFVMAGLAGIRPNIKSWIGGPRVFRLVRRLCVFCRRFFVTGVDNGNDRQNGEQQRKDRTALPRASVR